jgi:hypothetical protein
VGEVSRRIANKTAAHLPLVTLALGENASVLAEVVDPADVLLAPGVPLASVPGLAVVGLLQCYVSILCDQAREKT